MKIVLFTIKVGSLVCYSFKGTVHGYRVKISIFFFAEISSKYHQMYIEKVKMPILTIFRGRRPLKTPLFYSRKSVKMENSWELLLWTQFLSYNDGIGTKMLRTSFPSYIRSQFGQRLVKNWSKLVKFGHFDQFFS